MKEFADELRSSREAKQISLSDISSATKIQLKYLRLIEEGNFSFLPQPYVRAFVRDYAKALQLDSDEVLHRYDVLHETMERSIEAQQPERKTPQASPYAEEDISPPQTGFSRSLWLSFRGLLRENVHQRKFVPVIAVVFLVAAVVLVANLTRDSKKESTVETPFEQIIREKERVTSGLPDSGMTGTQAASGSLAFSDSLILEGTTTNQVWMRLLIDDRKPEEYLFSPKVQRTWKAREKFLVTLGDAGGITFRLNGKDLGTLGKPGTVIRNTLITRDGVQR